ncbi:AAA family ATPase [Eisenibacter elegans]|uniref:AAA family ATPase n=1 Tax=Eisenibacter elegans TaxID=997 RepID=UPI0003F6E619|nr:SMC family ATPase [Eisenibacter elegans]
MIPQKLILQGLYSYTQLTEVDFASLSQARLFGIFGAVGSGKSTLLDAITLALFGQVDRMTKANMGYNLMNLKSDRLYVSFEFIGGRTSQRYKFEVSYRRNSRNFADVTKQESTRYCYDVESKNWLPTDLEAEDILGLSYENFRRVMIIPQGKFQEFLQIGHTARTRMLKELFDLHRYDLYDEVTSLIQETKEAIAKNEGEMQGLQEVDLPMMEKIQAEIDNLQEEQHITQDKLQKLRTEYEQWQQARQWEQEYRQAKATLDGLEAQRYQWEARKQSLERYEIAKTQLADLLDTEAQLQAQLQQTQTQRQTQTQALQTLTQNLAQQQAALHDATQVYQQRDLWRIQLEDWQRIVAIQQTKTEIAEQQERLAKGQTKLQANQQQQTRLAEEAQKLAAQLTTQKQGLLDEQILSDYRRWFDQQQLLEEQWQQYRIQSQKQGQQYAQIQETIEAWANAHIAPLNSSLQHTPDSWEETLEAAIRQTQQTLEQASRHLEHLRVQAGLVAYAESLQPGRPCPLCGATDHPHPMDIREEFGPVVEAQTAERDKLQDKHTYLLELQKELREKRAMLREKHSLRQENIRQEAAVEERLRTHATQFPKYGQFSLQNKQAFEQAEQQQRQQRQALEQIRQALEDKQAAQKAAQEDAQKFQDLYKEIEIKLATLQGQLADRLAAIQQLHQPEHLQHPDPTQMQAELNTRLQQAEQTYTRLQTEVQKQQQAEAHLKGVLESLAQVEEKDQQALAKTSAILQDRLQIHQFADKAAVRELLAQALDTAQERAALQAFEAQLAQAAENLRQRKSKLDTLPYDQQAAKNTEDSLKRTEERQRHLIEQLATAKQRLENARKDWEIKQRLQTQLTKLEERRTNLNDLKKLFTAEGFVNYVSTTFLQNICALANERFSKLTKQQLRLEYYFDPEDNAKGEIIIRDMLNEGRTRITNTLSGGQTFQASLCLALALVDSIQEKLQSNQKFFFMDEGFGSLDEQAIQTVFETLRQLQYENRIVGIISHVEQLKRQIPVYLDVTRDAENGSLCHPSW